MDEGHQSPFELTVSQSLDPRIIVTDLDDYFALTQGRVMFVRAAAHSDLPLCVQLVAAALAWAPLTIAASTFLKRLSEKAADATWEVLKKRFSKSDKGEVALSSLISALSDARSKMGEKGVIIFGLNFPHSYWGTVVIVREGSPTEIARSVARFIVSAEKIDNLIRQKVDSGSKPLGYVHIELEIDGRVKLHWLDQDFKNEEHFIE